MFRTDYKLLGFLDDYGAALGAADLVLARAGGGVWELAAAGKPAILVPETELGRVPELVRSLLDDPRRLEQMGAAMLRAARPDAADEIAEELIALARG